MAWASTADRPQGDAATHALRGTAVRSLEDAAQRALAAMDVRSNGRRRAARFGGDGSAVAGDQSRDQVARDLRSRSRRGRLDPPCGSGRHEIVRRPESFGFGLPSWLMSSRPNRTEGPKWRRGARFDQVPTRELALKGRLLRLSLRNLRSNDGIALRSDLARRPRRASPHRRPAGTDSPDCRRRRRSRGAWSRTRRLRGSAASAGRA